MAFEVFDDVAFYWFLQVILGITLLPLTLYRIFTFFTRSKKLKRSSHPIVSSIPDYIPKIKLISEEDKSIDNKLSLSNIFFTFSWILFLLLLIQLPKWHNAQMTSFEPYDILEVPKGSTDKQIKRSYRKMSLKYHPDKCTLEPPKGLGWTERKCNDLFIMVRKAYETLTDEATKDNYEKYGNPDGYKGTMVTIGLPSWLTHKDNELIILSVYFILLILLVSIVWTWWNHKNKFHKSGVYKRSIDIYWRFIKQNMRLRHLLDILAASAEYRVLDVNIPNDSTSSKFKAFQVLEQEILNIHKKRGGANLNKSKLDNIFTATYCRKSAALLHAHLMGMQIPFELQNEYLLVLQEAPRLLDVMIDMTVSRERYWSQTLQLIQLKQAIIQGVWPMESHLKQLPHWTPAIDSGLRKLGYENILKLNYLTNDELNNILKNVYSQYSDDHSHLISPLKDNDNNNLNDDGSYDMTSNNTSGSYQSNKKKKKQYGGSKKNKRNKKKNIKKKQSNQSPTKSNQSNTKTQTQTQTPTTTDDGSNKDAASQTEDDDTDKDILPPGQLATESEVIAMTEDAAACIRMYPFVQMKWCARTYEEKEIYNEDIVKVSIHLERLREPWTKDSNVFVSVSKMDPPEFNQIKHLTDDDGVSRTEYDDDDGLTFVNNELEDARRLQIARLNAPVVHVNKFPFRIREKWLIMLVDRQNSIVLDQRAIPDLSGIRKVDLHFRAQKQRSGKYSYMLVCKCDSYLGADKHVSFDIYIDCETNKRTRNIRKNDEDDEEQPDYQIPDADDDNHDPKWYYLWNESFWEFLLTLFLLYFIYLVIMSSSWGKKYFQKYVDILMDYVVLPIINIIDKNVNDFIINPITKQLLKETGFDIIKWWYNIDDPDPDDDSDDTLSEEDQEFFRRAQEDYEKFQQQTNE